VARLAKLLEQRPVLRIIALRFRPHLGLLDLGGFARFGERTLLTRGKIAARGHILMGRAVRRRDGGRLLTSRRTVPGGKRLLTGHVAIGGLAGHTLTGSTLTGRDLTGGGKAVGRGFPLGGAALSGVLAVGDAFREGAGLRELADVLLSAGLSGGHSLHRLFIRDHGFLSGHKLLLLLFRF